jgi:hypothetical protein
MIQGIKTKYYSDVKMPIIAGMPFGSKDYKLKKVGYEIFRHYFDTIQKDCQVGSERIKRIINK